MRNVVYLLRLDDACPSWREGNWRKIEKILDNFGIKPLVGVIPNCQDEQLLNYPKDEDFWNKVEKWQHKGWAIAMHGYNHVYSSQTAGINPFWHRSEFAGLPLEEQSIKIKKGVEILRSHGIEPKYFFAPSHTFDQNTLLALKEESEIRIISDTVAFKPYRKGEFVFIPQILGHCASMPIPGIYTFCIHPNTFTEHALEKLSDFIYSHSREFISFSDIDVSSVNEERPIDRCVRKFFFLYRRLRGQQ